MKQFRVYYNDSRRYEYYTAKSQSDAISKFCKDVGLSHLDAYDVWAEEVKASDFETDFIYRAESTDN